MNKIKFDINAMKFISMFESLTNAGVKDCFQQRERIIFIVNENDIGKALGKAGSNIKRIENAIKKKIKIIEFNPDVLIFVQNAIYPLKVKDITEENKVITIIPPDSQTRGYLIGRGAVNLRQTEEIVKRHFEVEEIRVV